MTVFELRRLMLKHSVSINDLIRSSKLPIADSSLRSYYLGRGKRVLPDAVAQRVEEYFRAVSGEDQ